MFTLKSPHAQAIISICLILVFLPALSRGEAAANTAAGSFAFFDTMGNAVGEPIVFNDDVTGQVAAGNLNNNQFVIAYSSGADAQGKLAIYDNLGNVLVPAKVFNNAKTDQVSAVVLNNNNIWLTFINDNDARGAFAIYDATGAEVKSLTNFTDNAVDDLTAIKMADGNILILYSDTISNQGFYNIYNPDGNLVKAAQLFSATKPANLAAALLSNYNIFVAYSDTSNANAGTYFIIDQAGNLNSNPAVFSATDTGAITITSMNNDRAMIAYADNKNNTGQYAIYSRLGYLVVAAQPFSTAAVGTVHSSLLHNNNVIIAYGHPDTSTSTSNIAIYTNRGNQYMAGTAFANQLAGSIFTLPLSNFNQLVVYNNVVERACTADDWTATFDPEVCPASGQQTKIWQKTGICSGGVVQPAAETKNCETAATSTPTLCGADDWEYTLSPTACPASGKQIKHWKRTTNCASGLTRPENETIACAYTSPSGKIKIKNLSLYKRLMGRIVLKIQSKGEAYYIDAKSLTMYYLGRPADAFQVMREQGVGITNADLAKIPVGGASKKPAATNFSKQQAGKILLQVQSHGEAWYVNPVDGLRYYLGKPADAFVLMRSLGLGISNNNLDNLQK